MQVFSQLLEISNCSDMNTTELPGRGHAEAAEGLKLARRQTAKHVLSIPLCLTAFTQTLN